MLLLTCSTAAWCDPSASAEVSEGKPELEDKGNRLRFRSGPVCLCSGGLSEADIQRAERQRRGELPEEMKPRKKTDREEE